MDVQVLSVSQEVFRDRAAGREQLMYRVYLMADGGRVGFAYSTHAYKAGDWVRVTLGERDGKLKLKLTPIGEPQI